MTSRHMAAAWLLVTIATAASLAHAQRNPGFEAAIGTGTETSEVAPGWRVQNATAAIVLDTSASHSGAASLRVDSLDGRGRGRFFQVIDTREIRGERLRVSAFVRTSAQATGVAALRAWVRDAAGIIYIDRVDAASANAWSRLTIDVPLAPTAVEISLGGELTGQGSAWFDDFTIERVDTDALAPPSAAASRYIAAALSIIEAQALVRTELAWPTYRAAVMRQARGAVSVTDSYLAVRYAVGALSDGHSHFRSAAQTDALARAPVENARTRRPFVAPRAQLIADTIGYLSLPGFAGGAHMDRVEFAEDLQRSIAVLDVSAECGWIVDLRGNSGGNLWPMLAGLGPLLGDGEAGATVWPDGERRAFWYEDGKAGLGDYVQLRVRGEAYRLRRAGAPIAVLLDEDTASAAEILAIAFAARPRTRSFGAPTAGATTATRTFRLSDGAELILAVARTSDRNGRLYAGPLGPDAPVAAGARRLPLAEQPVVHAARSWIESESIAADRMACAQDRRVQR